MWICDQKYEKKIVIAGNHDNLLQSNGKIVNHGDFEYLCDSGTEYEYTEPGPPDGKDGRFSIFSFSTEKKKVKIWGSPWTLKFPGMNPHCMAFTCDTEEELAEKWAMIPEDTDILITHGPPHGLLDWNEYGKQCGSTSLLEYSRKLPNLKLFCFGHIHEAYSTLNTWEFVKGCQQSVCSSLPIIVNCSHVNEHYQPVNKPIRVIL
jgi:hypothetical protein